MSDRDGEYIPPGNMHPVLAEIADAYTTPVASQYAREASTVIDDFLKQKQIVEDNAAAGQNFVNNLSRVRENLVGLVNDDPGNLPLAMGLVRPSIGAMLSTVVDHPQDKFAEHHDQISSEMERDIARAAVVKAAGQNDELAHTVLDRVAQHIPEEEQSSLRDYIGVQAKARQIDAATQASMAEKARQQHHDNTAWNYAAALVDPATGDVTFKPDWAQRVIANPVLTPQAKSDLLDTYGALRLRGDAPASNPFLVRDLVRRLAGRR